jgi:putative peptidoglycan lipid II flippase
MTAHTTSAQPHLTVSLGAVQRRPLISATAILMVAFMASRVLGMVRQTLFTAVFPTQNVQSSAFFTAFRAPDLIFNLISGGALTSAFLPTFAGYLARKTRKDEDEAWRVANTIFYLTMIVLLPVLAAGIVLAPLYVPLLADNPDPATRQALIAQTVPLTRIMLMQPLFMALVSICQGIANSYMRFTVPALAPLIYNLSIIAGILVGARVGIVAVGWGVAIGAALQFAVQIPFLPHGRRLLRFTLDLGAQGVHEIVRLMGPRLFGQAGVQLSFIVTTALANFLPNTPNLALNDGWTVILLPVGIFAQSKATTAFPALARLAAVGDREGFARTVSETVSMVFFLTVPATAGLILLAPRLTRVLFAYGNANTILNVHLITLAMIYYAVGVPGHALAEVFPRAFYALKDTRTPVLVTTWTLALAILLSTVAVRVIAGNDAVAGLALAISIAVLVEAVNLAIALHRKLPEFALGPLGWALARANAAVAVMLACMGWLDTYLTHAINPSRFGSFVVLCICIPVGAALYLGMAALLRAPEAELVLARARRRLHR